MLECGREAIALAEGKTRADLDIDRQLNLSLVRLLEIIGEAANRVPKAVQASYPQIPWAEVVSLRNRLIHGYDSVDFDVVWQVVTVDLPTLVVDLQETMPAAE
ncbi:MAG TPA: HepT-like ribonuclease domain-containing protein [Dehalococcoidia bacterium]|nr:HepT-like ribonuclease domain-containing protein [Dehalococcoidia bacterium]